MHVYFERNREVKRRKQNEQKDLERAKGWSTITFYRYECSQSLATISFINICSDTTSLRNVGWGD